MIRPTVPLREQLDELEAEFHRREREYRMMVADGQMRFGTADYRQQRLNAAIHTIGWLVDHGDLLREYILYATRAIPPADGGTWNPPIEVEPVDNIELEAAE